MKRVISLAIISLVFLINSASADMWREVLPGAPGSPNAAEVIRFDSQFDRGGLAGHADERDEFVLESWSYPGRINSANPDESVSDTEAAGTAEVKDSEETSIEISQGDGSDFIATVSEAVSAQNDDPIEAHDVN